MLGHNKRRLYLAYMLRKPTPGHPIKFHTAFLLTPKNPAKSPSKECVVYHVVNRLRESATGDLKEKWEYEVKRLSWEELRRSPTLQMNGVILLGKCSSKIVDERLESILETVPRKVWADEDLGWRCRHWIFDALDVRDIPLYSEHLTGSFNFRC